MGWLTQAGRDAVGAGVANGLGSVASSTINYFANKSLMDQQNQQQIAMWKMNNEYNSPTEQVKRLREAGINPFIMENGSAVSPSAAATPTAAPYSPMQMAIPQLDSAMGLLRSSEQQTNAMRDDLIQSVESKQFQNWCNHVMRFAKDGQGEEFEISYSIPTGVDKSGNIEYFDNATFEDVLRWAKQFEFNSQFGEWHLTRKDVAIAQRTFNDIIRQVAADTRTSEANSEIAEQNKHKQDANDQLISSIMSIGENVDSPVGRALISIFKAFAVGLVNNGLPGFSYSSGSSLGNRSAHKASSKSFSLH